jgi:hypothetical protein
MASAHRGQLLIVSQCSPRFDALNHAESSLAYPELVIDVRCTAVLGENREASLRLQPAGTFGSKTASMRFDTMWYTRWVCRAFRARMETGRALFTSVRSFSE